MTLQLLEPSPETLAYLAALAADEAEYQAAIMQARKYDDGQQFVSLTDRLRTILGGADQGDEDDWKLLRLNVCHIVLTAVAEKLIVSGFDTDEAPVQQLGPDGKPETVKPVAAWAWRTWQKNRMDAKAAQVHAQTLRDSEAFVIVDWDAVNGRARFTPHQRYVAGDLDGDDQGCRAFYRNDDPDQELLFCTKQWTEVTYPGGLRTMTRRLTMYYPDRIEKYKGFPGAWEATTDAENEPWPIPWLDKARRPLGIPVAHFRSSAGMEAREAWPLQNGINKLLVDFLAESDLSAFRILVAFGWKPVDDDGNPLPIEPGRWLGSEKTDGKVQDIPGAPLEQFLNGIDSLVYKVATVTGTPITRFIVSKAVAAEGTQKEQQASLISKARARQGEIGNGWEDAMSIARRLHNTFGRGGLDETALLQTQWEPLEARDETAELTRAKLKKDLGMPVRLIAEGLGLTPEQIDTWEQEAEARRAVAQAAFGGQSGGSAPTAAATQAAGQGAPQQQDGGQQQ